MSTLLRYMTIPALLMLTLCAQGTYIEISPTGFNRLVFPVAVTSVHFTPDAPINGAPVSLAENRTLLFLTNGKPGVTFQAVIETADSVVHSLNFRVSSASKISATWRYKGAPDVPVKDDALIGSRPSDAFIVSLFASLAEGRVPVGFRRAGIPHSAVAGHLTLTGQAMYTDGKIDAHVFTASSDAAVVVEPFDFHHEGVIAASASGDRVSKGNPVTVLIVTTKPETSK
jgi:hypothetical protein